MAEKWNEIILMNNINLRSLNYIELLVGKLVHPDVVVSGVFRGCPPFGPTIKFFKGDFIWKDAFFAVFQQELQNSAMFDGLFSYRYNMRLKSPCEIASDMTLWFSAFPNFRKKWANLRLPLNVQKQKVFQLQGAKLPWPPHQGLCPWTPLGAPPPDPRYRLVLCALAMPPFAKS